MSLTSTQKKQSSVELHENFKILGYSAEKICTDLKLSQRALTNTLDIGFMTDPVSVWRLRDYMEEKILEQGKIPKPYSILNHNIYYPYNRDWD